MKRLKVVRLTLAAALFLLAGVPASPLYAAERCENWVALPASIQGSVVIQRAGETTWVPLEPYDIICPGDLIHVQRNSQATIVSRYDEGSFDIDQETYIQVLEPERDVSLLAKLIEGVIYFFSRTKRNPTIMTPFANGAAEGTEFLVKVRDNQTQITVFEGRVRAENEEGSLLLASGQSAIAKAGQAPVLHTAVRPRDAVQWALYYPPVIDYKASNFPGVAAWQQMVRESIGFYRKGDLANALTSLADAPAGITDPRYHTYRAGLALTVGQVADAAKYIQRALDLDPANSHAFALRSVIAVVQAVVQSEKQEALDLARKAVASDPNSAAARVALSYAQQASFELQAALSSLREAVARDPENSLAWARLSELWLSVGNLTKALGAAQKAASLNPNLARTQSVLGFAYLAQIKTRDAKGAFEKAIRLDQGAPLPRLGLGLARIREGELKEGRREIEIAAALDPGNSLIRSYLGKAFFDEKRDEHANTQLARAKELDPMDPTPWFYDAIRKQTLNRPVEALHDLQRSIELNGNRAVYRSRLRLDEDLAARSSSLALIYSDLGFQQLALVEGWKSLNTDPSSHSAHRFLADSYAAIPRHEIARVSELLQSQLLQPVNINPVQSYLAESNLFMLEGTGPSSPSPNEYSLLFHRDRLFLHASGIAGANGISGHDIALSAVWGGISGSAGQFHYSTDGFRENNDLEQDISNAFLQANLTHRTSIQAEYRRADTEKGTSN